MKFFDCPFCPLASRHPGLNTRLLIDEPSSETITENELFVVVPDAAPIRAGHALLVLKEHETSAFGSQQQNWPAIEHLCTEMETRIKSVLGTEILIWEHGSVSKSSSPGCIEHAHLHILPTTLPARHAISTLIGTELMRIDHPQSFLSKCDSQYVLLRDIDSSWYGLGRPILESQLFRRSLAHTGNLNLSSWQQYFTDEHIDSCRQLFLESWKLLKQQG